MSWSTSELRVRLAPWNRFKPSSKIFLLTVPRRYFFCGSFVLLMSCVCHVFASVHCCLLAPAGKGLTSLLSFVICHFPYVVSWIRCCTWLHRFLIFASSLTLTLDNGSIVLCLVRCMRTYPVLPNMYLRIWTTIYLHTLCGWTTIVLVELSLEYVLERFIIRFASVWCLFVCLDLGNANVTNILKDML